MPSIYIARSVKTGKWASDVGLGKHIYKLGVTNGDPKEAAAAGWAGETDWSIVKAEAVEGLDEDEAIDRLAGKERMIDPNLYPKLKGARGVFRINPAKVENHIVVSRALAGESDLKALKLKPADFATYLIANAKR
ncbi:MAG TPA: hypothetical protein VFQ90_15390 [Stellaceae bacterium]|jgi:hypothetical protein|nr:hypothetical protein [Stellaceae bacterium]